MQKYMDYYNELKIQVEPPKIPSVSDLQKKIEEKILTLRKSKNSNRVRQSPAKAAAIDEVIKQWENIKGDSVKLQEMAKFYDNYHQMVIAKLDCEIGCRTWSDSTITKNALKKLAAIYNVTDDFILKKYKLVVEEINLVLHKIDNFTLKNEDLPYFRDMQEVDDIVADKDYKKYSQSIGNNLQILGMSNIYEFLGNSGTHIRDVKVMREKSSSELIAVAEKLRDNIYKESTEGKNIVNALTGKDGILSNAVNRKKYDLYLDQEIDEQIKILKRIEGVAIDSTSGDKKYIFDSQMQPFLRQLREILVKHGKRDTEAEIIAKSMAYQRVKVKGITWILPWVYCLEASKRIKAGDLESAEKCIEVAEAAHVSNGAMVQAQNAVEEYRKNSAAVLEKIEACRRKKCYVEANELLRGNECRIPQHIQKSISAVLETAHRMENSIIAANLDEDQIFDKLKRIQELCSDYNITGILNRFPPERPDNIMVTESNSGVEVKWDYFGRKENVEFIVIRKNSEIVQGGRSGIEIGKTCEDRMEDREPEVVNYYAVYAKRGDAVSEFNIYPRPIVRLRDIASLEVVERDGVVRIAWHDSINGKVRVRKRVEGSSVALQNAPLLPNPVQNEMVDYDVINGKTYEYLFYVEIDADGKTFTSKGNVITVSPDVQLPPVYRWDIARDYSKGDGNFQVTWDADPRGSVEFYRISGRESVEEGIYLDYSSFKNKHSYIPLSVTGIFQGVLELPVGLEKIYVIAVLLYKNTIVTGNTICVSTYEYTKVKDIRIYHDSLGIFLQSWPEQYSGITVCYRFDQFPMGPEDAEAHAISIDNKDEYAREEVIKLPLVYTRYYIVLYGRYNSRKGYSAGLKLEFQNEKKCVIYYKVNYSSGIFGGKIKNVNIQFYGEDVQYMDVRDFPNITIRKNNKYEPTSLTDNSVSIKDIIDGNTLEKIAAGFRCDLEGEFARGDFIKVFCMNVSDEKRFLFEAKELKHYKI